mmetsp:Transcript_34051/g.93932  ORF Transcript_34051/g.93932 Transcript_34051/m.93932 type:complete len:240 (-) Transcript_34051:379-1098(-)
MAACGGGLPARPKFGTWRQHLRGASGTSEVACSACAGLLRFAADAGSGCTRVAYLRRLLREGPRLLPLVADARGNCAVAAHVRLRLCQKRRLDLRALEPALPAVDRVLREHVTTDALPSEFSDGRMLHVVQRLLRFCPLLLIWLGGLLLALPAACSTSSLPSGARALTLAVVAGVLCTRSLDLGLSLGEKVAGERRPPHQRRRLRRQQGRPHGVGHPRVDDTKPSGLLGVPGGDAGRAR